MAPGYDEGRYGVPFRRPVRIIEEVPVPTRGDALVKSACSGVSAETMGVSCEMAFVIAGSSLTGLMDDVLRNPRFSPLWSGQNFA